MEPTHAEVATDPNAVPEAEEEIRTLFVSGLPHDCMEREVYGLFRGVTGFLFANMKRDASPVAFVVFSTQTYALLAMEGLKGAKFDLSDTREEVHGGLKMELAKNNSRSKRERGGFGGSGGDKRFKAGHTAGQLYGEMPSGDPYAAYAAAGMDPSMMYQQAAYQAAVDPYGYALSQTTPAYGSMGTTRGSSNPPCTTIFIANLGSTTTEDEMRELFNRMPGFKRMKFQATGRQGPVAFIDFENEVLSGVALSQLQGYTLTSSDRGGMRVEFAKKPMGQGQR